MSIRRQIPLVACLAPVACSQPAPLNDGLPGGDVVSDAILMQKQTSTPHAGVGDGSTDAASFTVDPGHVFDCADSQQVVAKLAWTVKDPTVTTVNIVVVDKTSAASKTFAEGGNAGQATTAKWVSDGTRRVWWAGADQFGLELPSCWRIGDKPSDMAAAIAAKVGHRHLVEHPNNLQVITQSLARMTA